MLRVTAKAEHDIPVGIHIGPGPPGAFYLGVQGYRSQLARPLLLEEVLMQRLVEAGFGERVKFGSDQMIWPKAIEVAIEAIESAPFLDEEQKRDIFYNNAARFVRLSEDKIARHHAK